MARFALLLFPGLTQLDLTAPYEVFCRAPDAEVHLLWKDKNPVRTEHGMMLSPTITLAELDRVDVLCVPGGFGINALLGDAEMIAHIRRLAVNAQFVTSVCTGALLLGAAGLLRGRHATTHWTAMDFLPAFGATPVAERWVEDGGVITGGGVTAGLDFALYLLARLHGEAVAQAVQLSIEYDPAPPFTAGHPDRAAPELVEAVRRHLAGAQARRADQVAQAVRHLQEL